MDFYKDVMRIEMRKTSSLFHNHSSLKCAQTESRNLFFSSVQNGLRNRTLAMWPMVSSVVTINMMLVAVFQGGHKSYNSYG